MKKVVIHLSGGNQKTRMKAMKIASGTSGVIEVAIGGDDKSKLEVTGEGVDAADLTLLLRQELARKCCFLRAKSPAGVSLASVGPVEQEKNDKPTNGKPECPKYCGYPPPTYCVHELQGEPACACSIL